VDLGIRRGDNQPGRSQFRRANLLLHANHAALTICGFIASFDGSMIDIISSGKR
jgi:hypothetical protein